ncbi:MAG TPA: neutral zinc metallopeptidase [Brevundimonas sp.]|jgi:predicted metalloprotease|uniref:KPN_02809 family neutral zinc metallopeptidase n=1 Tax=Brevundimonas sp. TaxID=1871086 RepID=UPI002B66B3AB|nr:neutral zinc metallopeptidase [Brevundimonas sp.]HRH20936.1 neutral zinc metallopeptidase [Brevundimonas sp.]
MRWQGGRRGGGIDDRRGMGAGGVVGGGLGVMVLALVGYIFLGIDPNVTTQVATQLGMGQGGSTQGDIGSPDDPAAQFVEVIQTSTTDVWSQLIPGYEQPQVVIYEGGTGTACGLGQAAMGPFYCPLDRQVYLDLGFWNTMSEQLGASGDFAQAYVIAHEVGHHVQTLDGTADRVRQAQSQARSQAEANQWQVAMELQADCYAGVWAARVGQASNGQVTLEPGDIEEGLNAASRIGDDVLSGGRASPESFTHGSSEQRVEWLRRGLQSGDPAQCDTFGSGRG